MCYLLLLCLQVSVPTDLVRGPDAKRIDAFLQGQSWFSGAVMVVREGEMILHRGYGWSDRKKTVPVRTDTLFGIASISKQFTASAIMLLVEEGKLSLDDPLTRFFEDAPEDKRAIRVHQLLTHTAGLANNYAADGIPDPETAARELLKPPLRFPVGEKFGYTNDAYCLAALIVERVSGQPFDAFLSERLFQPAGMQQTRHWGSVDMRDAERVGQVNELPSGRYLRPNYGFRGATGLLSTSGDLYRWHLALMEDRVLKKESRERLLQPAVAFSRGMVGYGWFHEDIDGERPTLWTRGAEDYGHGALLKFYKHEKLLLIITANVEESEEGPGPHRLGALLEPVLFP